MNIKKNPLLLLPVFIYVVLIIPSCRKADRNDDKETQSSIDNGIAQHLFNDVFKQVAYYADTNNLFKLAAGPSCDTSWVTGTLFPKTLTIKYDSLTGCNDAMGVSHKGKIKATFSKKFTDSLSVVTTTFSYFYRDNYKITGTQTITNKGRINGKLTFSIKVSDALILTPEGKTITWNALQTYKLIAGDSTNTYADDVFSITGSSNGVGTKGTSFIGTINTALRFELGCKYITSGTLTLSPGSLESRSVDFGTGGCDNAAVVTLTGKTFTISIL